MIGKRFNADFVKCKSQKPQTETINLSVIIIILKVFTRDQARSTAIFEQFKIIFEIVVNRIPFWRKLLQAKEELQNAKDVAK